MPEKLIILFVWPNGYFPFSLCRLADKVLLKAKDELLAGDQEQAYILYMRFIDMYKVIYASKEYKRDKGEFNKLLPTSKVCNYYTGRRWGWRMPLYVTWIDVGIDLV